MTCGRVAMEIQAASRLENAMEFNEAGSHHGEVSHHGGAFEKAAEGFHHLHHGDIRAGVNELAVNLGGVGPCPGVGESVELGLAGLAGHLAEEDVIVRVGIEGRIEVNEVNAGVGKFFRVAQPAEVVAKEKAVHAGTVLAEAGRGCQQDFGGSWRLCLLRMHGFSILESWCH